MLGTTIGGIAVVAVVATPALAEQAALLIPAGFVTGALLAMPLSYVIAKKIAAGRTA
jgi:hypothetical protein